jgi:hypothetical protein
VSLQRQPSERDASRGNLLAHRPWGCPDLNKSQFYIGRNKYDIIPLSSSIKSPRALAPHHINLELPLKMAYTTLIVITTALLLICLPFTTVSQLIEHERVQKYHESNYTWPPSDDEFVPHTDGWRRLMQRRFDQVQRIENSNDQYNGWVSTIHAALVCPNFTEYGWALTRAPQPLIDDMLTSLKSGLNGGLDNLPVEHGSVDKVIDTPHRPLFHEQTELNRRAMVQLHPIVEAWINNGKQRGSKGYIPLIANNAYGLRLYQNQSRLNMHVDKSETHIVSAIFHIDHDKDSKPWPLVIEDYHGNVNEVVLESGDVLLYESSKCWHGRPIRFEGSWYTSLFIHYFPGNWKREQYENGVSKVHYRIPPNWNAVLPPRDDLERLVMVETSAYEPECENTWCLLNDTKKWNVRGEFGKILSGDEVVRDLHLIGRRRHGEEL